MTTDDFIELRKDLLVYSLRRIADIIDHYPIHDWSEMRKQSSCAFDEELHYAALLFDLDGKLCAKYQEGKDILENDRIIASLLGELDRYYISLKWPFLTDGETSELLNTNYFLNNMKERKRLE